MSEVLPADTPRAIAAPRFRVPLTSFVGRKTEAAEVRRLLAESRLVTLSGAGGSGKTRLAFHIAGQTADAFTDGVCFVDFAPIVDPDLVAVTVARALDLPDQPGRSAIATLLGFVSDQEIFLLLDNCEHVL
ncbi:MAG TPA: LuxR family transcriptional regulator, partial [Mycobacterium sp.]|nr:LuxR family transcriptional regulator [Mycobacterium sp.]